MKVTDTIRLKRAVRQFQDNHLPEVTGHASLSPGRRA